MGSDNLWICVIMAPAGRCRRDSASVTYDSTLPQPHPPAPTAGTILPQIPAIREAYSDRANRANRANS